MKGNTLYIRISADKNMLQDWHKQKDLNMKHMLWSRDQNAGRSHNMKTYNRSLKRWKSSNIWEQL
jgi:hypothetical protein